jgi:peptidoglycan-associated lipoprotein
MMKGNAMINKLPLLVLAIAVLAGCSNTPQQETTVEKPQLAQSRPAATTQTVTASAVQETESQDLGRLFKAVEGQSIYFAYDDFTIQAKYQPSIQAHAEVLNRTAGGTVVLEGNADERGSSEYNLALGQKRAEAIAHALKALGVPADKIEAISLGKEKPRALCHHEKCWAENRRVDFTYKLNSDKRGTR